MDPISTEWQIYPMNYRIGPWRYSKVSVAALVGIIIGALIILVLSFIYDFQTTGTWVRPLVQRLTGVSLDAVVPTLIITGFSILAFCYVIIRALVRHRRQKGSYGTDRGWIARRRTGPLRYIEIAVRILVWTPIGMLVSFVLSIGFNIPTPGMYAAMILVPDPTSQREWLAPLIPRLFVAGLVNVICFYVVLGVLVAMITRLRRQKNPAAPGGRP